MLWFVHGRDRPGTAELRHELTEAHWSFMDDFADVLVARGPTLTPDRTRATGSLHIVDLPDAAAARSFAFDEPNYRAGVYADVLIRRFTNVTGRTMWQFPGTAVDDRYLILAPPTTPEPTGDNLIVHGPLLTDDGTTTLGTAILIETPTTTYPGAETHPWQFGGRS